jgi:hypothetical protein
MVAPAVGQDNTAIKPATAAERIYIHETIEISVRRRQQYLEHFMSWGPISRRLYNMRLVGVWAVNGATHRWAEAIVLWELDGTAAYTKMLSGEYAFLNDSQAPVQDHYTMFWGHAPEGVVDTRGSDRLLAPTSYTPSVEQAIARTIKGVGYLHQTFTGPAGSMNRFLTQLGSEWQPVAERLGLRLVGAYRSMLLNDSEAVAIWAIPTWDHWAHYEAALYSDRDAIAWRAEASRAGVGWEGKLLNAVAGSPLDAGKLT